MRLDIITIFPDYFAPLDISLLGKARRRGLIEVHVHDLRQWTHDRHRTVDDTPYGGGPGMVMKPDPWGEALDTIAPPPTTPDAVPERSQQPPSPDAGEPAAQTGSAEAEPGAVPYGEQPPPGTGASAAQAGSAAAKSGAVPSGEQPSSDAGASAEQAGSSMAEGGAVSGREERPFSLEGDESAGRVRASAAVAGPVPRLIVPTPSGRPFTQEMAVELAAEPWLIFACGRYEGIDARVVEEARTRMRVDEVSIGDYVLAGGEAAVLVIVEAVGRLVPGVLGNAESVADDSFAPGAMQTLLEGPVYTKPPVWRDRAVPEVLLSGNHGAIARWRRDQALRRTVANRPDLAASLDPGRLDERDRQVLAEAGLPTGGEPVAD
ncbi:tRNA (guanine37-N1)-methyltransferase [Actinomadura cellulosilytica]|uniref:tRNA (guanine-N(1)-)-methyltransferase n=1 Tax=Thermomonospora cellulosilytica TaxID=1411118 RepID=A0A7W3RBS8_9ACTN|nr:tRNA (guanine37-N1)-methyltransferase [Thermomonospora cellulosilytica]